MVFWHSTDFYMLSLCFSWVEVRASVKSLQALTVSPTYLIVILKNYLAWLLLYYVVWFVQRISSTTRNSCLQLQVFSRLSLLSQTWWWTTLFVYTVNYEAPSFLCVPPTTAQRISMTPRLDPVCHILYGCKSWSKRAQLSSRWGQDNID